MKEKRRRNDANGNERVRAANERLGTGLRAGDEGEREGKGPNGELKVEDGMLEKKLQCYSNASTMQVCRWRGESAKSLLDACLFGLQNALSNSHIHHCPIGDGPHFLEDIAAEYAAACRLQEWSTS